jgi:predicted nucleotidyltransferase
MKDSENILSVIKTTIKRYIPDAEVSLFGSRAKELATEESDYDILVVTQNELTTKEKMPLKTTIRKDLLKLDIRTDILIQSQNEIRKKRRLPGHIIRSIIKESILL